MNRILLAGELLLRALGDVGYWAGQQLAACLAPMLVCELMTFPWLGWNEHHSPIGPAGFQILQAVAIGIGGCALGLIFGRDFPFLRPIGRWIWVPPTALLAVFIGNDLRTFGPGAIAQDFFWDFRPGSSEGPLGREVTVYPAWSSICYSLGVCLAGALSGRRGAVR